MNFRCTYLFISSFRPVFGLFYVLIANANAKRIAASNDPFCFIAANIRIQFSGNSVPLCFFNLWFEP